MGFTDAKIFDGGLMSAPGVTDNTQESSKASVVERSRPRSGLLDWLFVRAELARTREAAARFTVEQREYLRRAKLALELGELASAPGGSVRSGSTAPLSANLFRQSLYWALLARRPEAGLASPEAIWGTADTAALSCIAADEQELGRLTVAMRSTFVELAEASPDSQRATVDLLRRSAIRLATGTHRVLWQLEWSKLKRLIRVAALAPIAGVPLVLGLKALLIKPDLALGKPWHTSTIGIECHPEKSECGGTTTDIFFHTKLEQNPWFEYDFGAPLAFSSLTIRNRKECCDDRAVPLVVEASNDDKSFQEIARRSAAFVTWQPSFPTQHSRYLRLRVPRESILHLAAVQVHP